MDTNIINICPLLGTLPPPPKPEYRLGDVVEITTTDGRSETGHITRITRRGAMGMDDVFVVQTNTGRHVLPATQISPR